MKDVLVDTSIWIEYFRANSVAAPLFDLIDQNRIATNEVVLSELLPSINLRKEHRLKNLLLTVRKVELEIDWSDIVKMQTTNLKNGHNNVGIPDLIIAQNAIDHSLILFENDKHFLALSEMSGLELFRSREGR